MKLNKFEKKTKMLANIFFLTAIVLVLILVLSIGKEVVTYADSEGSRIELTQNSEILSPNYLDYYAIPSNAFTYQNNGGELSSNKLSNAFDRNFNTSFKSAQDNNVNYIDEQTGETKSNFINYIDISFKTNVEIDRVLYGSETSSNFRGYPTILNIYANVGSVLTLIKTFNSTETSNFVIFKLDNAIVTNKLRFEYVKVSTKHKFVATAREIMFLQPENDAYAKFNNLFSDYCELTLSEEANTLDKLNSIDNVLKSNVNYNNALKKQIERARKILTSEVVFDSQREFSTRQNATNQITQYGDIDGFCRNTLKMSSFGTNRQVSGICAKPEQQVVIYVDCQDGDPLPTVRFSQNHGYWSRWLSGNYALEKGKNILTVPYLKNEQYTIDTVDGGAIYIVNPYNTSQQSENVKIYIEGGDLYPVFKKGQNEQIFLAKLKNYYNKIQNDKSNVIDITEIVTDHIIFSGSASKAYDIFSGFSPRQCTENWDNYLDELLSFGGLDCNPSGKNYNPIYQHINANIRVSQPWSGAAAYAYTEHIGVYTAWEATGYYAQNFGWGISHELGHMLDTRGQIIGETTNNMYSKYNETVLEKISKRGDFEKTFATLSNDKSVPDSYFNQNRLNFLLWWYVEGYQNGFWGDLQNCYRGLNSELNKIYNSISGLKDKVENLNATEKQVFYASVVTKIDMSYYYDRWGFNLVTSDNVFKERNASTQFKECINILSNNRLIDCTQKPKFWYQDNNYYNEVHNKNCSMYNGTQKPVIDKAVKTDNGNSLFMKSGLDERHLGFEILVKEKDSDYKVIAFTRCESYLDTTSYDGTPTYKIRAYDKNFNASDYSDELKPQEITQNNVCKIGETYYNFISDAISSANENDTIIILKDTQEKNMVIDKNLTLQTSETASGVTVYKSEIGNFITINSGVTLRIIGHKDALIEFNGGRYSQNGCLINAIGSLNANFVNFINNKNTDNGGVIVASENAKIDIKNSLIKNNSALNGGVFYLNKASSKLNLQNVIIDGNIAKESGSVLFSMGTTTINNCHTLNNRATINGTLYSYAGGILKINGTILENNKAKYGGAIYIDGYTEINNCTFKNNIASTYGGAIYYSTAVDVRKLNINGSNFLNNKADNGRDIYLNTGRVNFSNSIIDNGQIYFNNGSFVANSECSISGEIVINKGTLIIKNGVFKDIAKATISVAYIQENNAIITTEEYDLTTEDLSKFKIVNEDIELILKDNVVFVKKLNIVQDDKNDVKINNSNDPTIIIVSIVCGTIFIAICLIMFSLKRKKKIK